MKKTEVLFILMIAATMLAAMSLITTADTGCCINPNVPSLTACQQIERSSCCPAGEQENQQYYLRNVTNQNVCESYFFYPASNCNSVNQCNIGCCCAEDEYGKTASLTYGTLCNQTFKPSEPRKTCDEVCEIEQQPTQTGCPLLNVTAITVKGEKQILLRWQETCNAESFQISRCKGNNCNNFQFIQSLRGHDYIDTSDSLRWYEYYTYNVTANIGTENLSQTVAIYTGDLECWKKYSLNGLCINEFSYNVDPIREYSMTYLGYSTDEETYLRQVVSNNSGKMNKGYRCDNNNLLTSPLSCSNTEICSVNSDGSPQCIDRSTCGSLGKPFGLFVTQQQCEQNYCFYDKSQGNVKACYDCSPRMSCYDYKTSQSCGGDNCGLGNCEWRIMNGELNTGVCIDTQKNNCQWCDKNGTPGVQSQRAYNEIFDACTDQKREKLSTTYFPCTGIQSTCTETCPDFQRDACISHSVLIFNQNDNSIIPRQTNSCGLNVCRWFQGVTSAGFCRKDADNNTQQDCVTNDVNCEKDYFPPETTIRQSGDELITTVIDKKNSTDYFPQYDLNAATYICAHLTSDTDAPCSNLSNYTRVTSQTMSIQGLVEEEFFKPGINKLHFYSKDTNKNLETVKTRTIEPGLKISLLRPNLGAVNGIIYNVTVKTSLAAVCRIGFTEAPFDNMATLLETTNGTIHKKTDFSGIGRLKVRCKDTQNRVWTDSFQIEIVTTNATIITYITPDTISSTPITAALMVESDQSVICKYSKNPSLSYENMIAFPGYDETDGQAYKRVNRKNITSADLTEYQTNNFHVTCRNKAGMLSKGEASVVVNVRIEADLDLIYKPYSSSQTFRIEARTNNESTCIYSNNSDYSNAISFGPKSTTHIATLNLQPGSYRYYVKCTFSNNATKEARATFVIDITPPTTPVVNDSEGNATTSPYLNKIYGSWKSTDDESGILRYNYSVYEKTTDTLIREWTITPDRKEVISQLSLSNDKKYYIKAKAQNRAELWSDTGESDGVLIMASGGGDDNTTTYHCNDKRKNSDEAGIDCGGKDCNKCTDGIGCRENNDCYSNNCGYSKLCIAPSCSDKIKNQNETDADCGGNRCIKCENNKVCYDDTDCMSNNCNELKCAVATDSCSNNQLDPATETDVDCGDTCARTKGKKCEEGKKCTSDLDCASYLCGADNTCKKDNGGENVTCQPDCPEPEPVPEEGNQLIKVLMWAFGILAFIGILIAGYMLISKQKQKKQPEQEEEMQYPQPRPREMPTEPIRISPETAKAIARRKEASMAEKRREILQQFETPKRAEEIKEKEVEEKDTQKELSSDVFESLRKKTAEAKKPAKTKKKSRK